MADTAVASRVDPAPDTVQITNGGSGSLDGLAVRAVNYGPGASGWLGTPTLTSTSAPGASVVIRPVSSGLTPGSYRATVTITATNAAADSLAVNLVVLAPPPIIGLARATVADTAVTGGANPPADTVAITNAGGGTLDGLAVGSIAYGPNGSGWLGTPTLTATAAPASLVLTPSAAGLAPASYSATVLLHAANVPDDSVMVTLVVLPRPAAVLIGSHHVEDSAAVSGARPKPDTLRITNGGGGTLGGLSVASITYAPGTSGWLSAALVDVTAPTHLVLTESLSGLAVGPHDATVTITGSNAASDTVHVRLVVTAAAPPPPPGPTPVVALSPSHVADTAVAGKANPTPDTVQVTNTGGGTLAGLSIQSVTYGQGGSGWLGASLSSANAPARLIVTPATGTLSPGSHSATLVVAGKNAAVDTLTVTFVVTAAAPPPPPPPSNATVRLGFADYVVGAVRDVAIDGSGNIIAVGGTLGLPFVSTPGVFPRNPAHPLPAAGDPSDVLITKMTPTGQVIWAALLGGSGYDRAYGVEVDAQGFIYVAGRAGAGFPVTTGAFQTTFMGGFTPAYGDEDGFICKLSPNGDRVVFCSYFGTDDIRIVRDVAVDHSGNIYLASGHTSGTYPAAVQGRFLNPPRGSDDGVVAKVATDGSRVLWARYIGGSGLEGGQNSVRVDAAGNVYFLCTTESTDAPTPNGAQHTYGGSSDLYLTKLTSAGAVLWATYIGGSGNESTETHELTVTPSGEAIVSAATFSTDFPTTPGVYQRVAQGINNIFISRYATDGRLLAATLIGGNGNDRSEGVAVDAAGNVYLTGTTTSTNFPLTKGVPQATLQGGRDAMYVVMSPDLKTLLVSTLYGGNGEDYGRAITVGPNGMAVIGGDGSSTNLLGAVGRAWEGFVARFNTVIP